MQSDRRIYLTSRGEPCEEGDPRAAFLLVCAGGQLADGRAAALGITRGEDGCLVLPEPTASSAGPRDQPPAGEPAGNGGETPGGTGDPAPPTDELEQLSRPELVKAAQACDIDKPHTQKSEKLIELIRAQRAAAAASS